MLNELEDKSSPKKDDGRVPKTIEVLMKQKKIYDAPDKGVLWGWEVSAYLFTKGIAAGLMLMGMIMREWIVACAALSLLFLAVTAVLLVKDLDKPQRFLYVLLRPQWKSWLTRGAYIITLFGACVFIYLLNYTFKWYDGSVVLDLVTSALAVLTAIYTGFLFAQGKGRDYWQSPLITVKMFIHSLLLGTAGILLVTYILEKLHLNWFGFSFDDLILFSPFMRAATFLLVFLTFDLFLKLVEHLTPAGNNHIAIVKKTIHRGKFSPLYWLSVGLSVASVVLLILGPFYPELGLAPFVAIIVMVAVYLSDKITVEAPQTVSLS